ncbi:hypothetical protein BC936DRAFT_146380 [Jimgerdemannia flammicorona]|uniref:Uncharacterized protein n=1 Tax=Jimgerdemannia flammicorona TaxID=994334 RepID=A0A433D7S6_9FUNG|nr:hypothetical protein BC936DRAFT_146380 [Jimgerdemannia flammicorona]
MTAVQELTLYFHDGDAGADHDTLDLNQLAGFIVHDGVDPGDGVNDVTDLQELSTVEHTEPVGQVDQLEQVTVDDLGEDRLDDGFPANNDGEIHRGGDDLVAMVNVQLRLIAHGLAELLDRDGVHALAVADELGRD